MSIRIILADDHRIMREGLCHLLVKQQDFEMVAEADDGIMAARLTLQLSPDVVVMDVSMPNLNGIEATRQIIGKNPNVKAIALSMCSAKQFVIEMLKAGASGYMLKDCAFEELVYAIHTVLKDQIYLSPGITTFVIKDYLRSSKVDPSSVFSILTDREREVLQLIAEGKTTKEIAFFLKREFEDYRDTSTASHEQTGYSQHSRAHQICHTRGTDPCGSLKSGISKYKIGDTPIVLFYTFDIM